MIKIQAIINHIIDKSPDYLRLMRADKPIGTVLLAWPMLWALWIASNGSPNPKHLIIFILGAFIMRSAGCVINDLADKNIDLKVKRTANRPLTAGKVTNKEAIILLIILIALAFTLLTMLPRTTYIYAIVAILLAGVYPFTKRFFVMPQLILGFAFSSAILMAFAAEEHSINLGITAWLMFICSSIWAIIYDTFYAMIDRDDDINLGIHSSALLFKNNELFAIKILMLSMLTLLTLIGVIHRLNIYYYLSLVFVSLCFIYQLIITKKRNRDACFVAFLNNQWVGMFVFLGILLSHLQ